MTAYIHVMTMSSHISNAALAARESARSENGQFGEQVHSHPERGLLDAADDTNPLLDAAADYLRRGGTAQEWLDAMTLRFEDGETDDSAATVALREAMGEPHEDEDPAEWERRSWEFYRLTAEALETDVL